MNHKGHQGHKEKACFYMFTRSFVLFVVTRFLGVDGLCNPPEPGTRSLVSDRNSATMQGLPNAGPTPPVPETIEKNVRKTKSHEKDRQEGSRLRRWSPSTSYVC